MKSQPETGGKMRGSVRFPYLALLLTLICVLLVAPCLAAQDSKIMGEIKFEGATKVEKDAGVWIDGEYVGYVKELKGHKKVLLLPGKHEITVRQSGYADFVQQVVVEPGEEQIVRVAMTHLPGAQAPAITAELKLTIQPARAAVFLDNNYVGHAGELGGDELAAAPERPFGMGVVVAPDDGGHSGDVTGGDGHGVVLERHVELPSHVLAGLERIGPLLV